MAKLGITQLEQATTIPNGSLHLVEMGDGSGTKAVTQEILAKETGEALKVGNPEDLQTEDKTSIVAAINEVAQSGGGGASVDVLDSKEEIEANTETGKVAGAAAVKAMFGELNDNLKGFEPIIDPETGQITGYKTTVGADTVFPFSNNFTTYKQIFGNSLTADTDYKFAIFIALGEITGANLNGYSIMEDCLKVTATSFRMLLYQKSISEGDTLSFTEEANYQAIIIFK